MFKGKVQYGMDWPVATFLIILFEKRQSRHIVAALWVGGTYRI